MTAATSVFRFLGASTISLPAFKACKLTLALPDTPLIARASVKIRPLKANSSVSKPYTTLREREEGNPPKGSITGTWRCPTIIPLNPARMASLKGYNSTLSNRSRVKGSTGNALWESTSVSPCPGKCLQTESTPPPSSPVAYAITLSATRTGSSPKERLLITGFLGLTFTSATGAKLTCTPSSRH